MWAHMSRHLLETPRSAVSGCDSVGAVGDSIRTPSLVRAASLLLATSFAACGGTTVIEAGGEGGAGGSGGVTTSTGQGGSTTSSTSSTSSGSVGCTTHEDCPGGSVCLFSIGECVPSCGEFCDACDPGTVCDGCATSSCPGCADCVAACIPIQPGQCDENDPCPDDAICLHDQRQCAPSCAFDGTCADPGQQCTPCATGSCCGCKNCVPACTPE